MGYLKIGKAHGQAQGPTYIFKENLDEYYIDISCVQYWYQATLEAVPPKDYLFSRTGSMGYIENVASGSFDNLSQIDQEFAAQNFVVDKVDRDKLYTDAEQEEYWSIFIAKSQEARQTRWNKVKSYISYRLTKDQSNEVADDTIILNEKYIYYGIESKAIDNVDGLFDYVEGTAAYSSSGFPSKPYYTTELRDGVMNFLNGTYNITP